MTKDGVLVLAPYPTLDGRWLALWVERQEDRTARTRVLAACPRVFADRSDAFQHAIDQARAISGDPRRTRKGVRYLDAETCDAFVMARGEAWACGSGDQWKVTRAIEAAEQERLKG